MGPLLRCSRGSDLLRYQPCCCEISALSYLCDVQVRVRFDVKEALRELTRLELVERVGSEEENGNAGSLYACVKSEDAIQHLEDTWRSILQGRLQSVEAPSN